MRRSSKQVSSLNPAPVFMAAMLGVAALSQLKLQLFETGSTIEKAKEVISNQRLIIAKLEKDVNNKIMTIDYLTQQLHKANTNSASTANANVNNLLDFD